MGAGRCQSKPQLYSAPSRPFLSDESWPLEHRTLQGGEETGQVVLCPSSWPPFAFLPGPPLPPSLTNKKFAGTPGHALRPFPPWLDGQQHRWPAVTMSARACQSLINPLVCCLCCLPKRYQTPHPPGATSCRPHSAHNKLKGDHRVCGTDVAAAALGAPKGSKKMTC